MQDPFDRLPIEIISKIISFIGQDDCLESMLVCHAWFDKMPTYTVNLWKDIFFHPDTWEEKNHCLLKCLGPHVQTAHVPYDYMNFIIPELVNRECMVTKLLIQPYYEIPPNLHFFDSLRKMGSQITKISLCHIYDVSLLEIAHTCPQLTQLEFRTIPGYERIPVSDQKEIQEIESTYEHHNEPLLPHLVYLILDDKLNLDTRMAPLLRQCPNLRVLELRKAEYESKYKIDMSRLIDLCPPHLYHLICHSDEAIYDDDSLELQSIINSSTTMTTPTGLKHLTFYHGGLILYPTINDMMQLSQKVKDTLTVLRIHQGYTLHEYSVNNWFNPPVHLPSLQQLELSGRFINTTLIYRLLDRYNPKINTSTFDSQLKTIKLYLWTEVFDNTLIQGMTNVRSLKSLTLHSIDRAFQSAFCGTVPTCVMYDTQLFHGFQNGQLREIELKGDTLISDPLLLVLSSITSLQKITLGYLDLDPKHLDADGGQSKLIHLVTRDGLLAFIARIRQYQDRHALQHLALINFYDIVDDSVIASIGDICLLKVLKLRRAFGVHDVGLKKFIDKKVGDRYLERIEIQGYKNLTRDGLEYAKYRSSCSNVQFVSIRYP